MTSRRSRLTLLGIVVFVLTLLVFLWMQPGSTTRTSSPEAASAPSAERGPALRKSPPAPPSTAPAPTADDHQVEAEAGPEPSTTLESKSQRDPSATEPEDREGWVRQALVKNVGKVQYCYESALQRDPQISGRVVVDIVAEAGEVIDVAWAEDETYDDMFVTCIESKLIGVEIGGNVDGDIQWPFVFRPAAADTGEE